MHEPVERLLIHRQKLTLALTHFQDFYVRARADSDHGSCLYSNSVVLSIVSFFVRLIPMFTFEHVFLLLTINNGVAVCACLPVEFSSFNSASSLMHRYCRSSYANRFIAPYLFLPWGNIICMNNKVKSCGTVDVLVSRLAPTQSFQFDFLLVQSLMSLLRTILDDFLLRRSEMVLAHHRHNQFIWY
jgi:hypothetical protein